MLKKECKIFKEVIVLTQINKKVLVNMGPQNNGFGDMKGYSFLKHLFAIIYYVFIMHKQTKEASSKTKK